MKAFSKNFRPLHFKVYKGLKLRVHNKQFVLTLKIVRFAEFPLPPHIFQYFFIDVHIVLVKLLELVLYKGTSSFTSNTCLL